MESIVDSKERDSGHPNYRKFFPPNFVMGKQAGLEAIR